LRVPAERGSPQKSLWICFVFLFRIEPFQRLALTPGAVFCCGPLELHERMVARRVVGPLLRGFADDLADGPGRQRLIARDRGVRPAFAYPSENARSPNHPPMRIEPRLQSGRRLLNHAELAFPGGPRRSIEEKAG
jgi:hypothetical protein